MCSKARALEAMLLAGCTVALAAYASIHANVPSLLSPYSYAAIMPAFVIADKAHFLLGYGTPLAGRADLIATAPGRLRGRRSVSNWLMSPSP